MRTIQSQFLFVAYILGMATVANSFQFPFFPTTPPPDRSLAQQYLVELEGLIDLAPKNGIDTPPDLESDIADLCKKLEGCNPTPKPVRNFDKMNGFWKMRWTNFSPAAPSSGKLGPLVGDVFQDIDLGSSNGDGNSEGRIARNILRVDFPPLAGELKAAPAVLNDSTVAITFQSVGNKLAGIIPLGPKTEFEPNKEVRLWEHVYLDENYRILYARRREDTEFRGFLYVMKRADDERFKTGV